MTQRLGVRLLVAVVVASLLGSLGLAVVQGGPALQGGAPTVVSYQGQVQIGGLPYSGAGYFKFAVVDGSGTTTYWSNDGTSAGGSEPTGAVTLAVQAGLFHVLLGDTTLTNMNALPAGVFAGTARWLRVWFSSNGVTFTLLSPDRRIAAVPYALQATNADLLDGLDSGDLAQKPANIVVVAKSGGDYTTIGAAMAAISASAGDRYLIRVAPGVYTESVTMEQYVDIEGAGEGVTKITYSGSVNTAGGTVLGATNAELRFLTVENTGGNAYAIAINNSSAAPHITHVTCSASGGTTASYGVYNSSGSPVMTHVSISVSGGATSFGVYSSGSSAPVLTHVTINATNTTSTYGMRSEGSSTPLLQDVSVAAAGGSGMNWAVRNDAPATLLNVVAAASGPTGSINYGVYNSDVVTMTQVTARASGGYDSYGVYNTSAQVVMLDVNAAAADASHTNSGVYSTYTSTVTMTQVVATVSGAATSNYGIYNAASSTSTMRHMTVDATNGMADNEYVYGIYNNTSAFTLDNSQVSATGGEVCYGVFNIAAAGAYTVTINSSQITGRTYTIRSDAEFTTFVGGSQLAGGAVSAGGGTVTCAGVFDEAYTFYASTCP